VSEKICIVRCIDDAQSFIRGYSGEIAEWVFFSTHGAVKLFLEEKGLNCTLLSEFLSVDFLRASMKSKDVKLDSLLEFLDEKYSPQLSSALGVDSKIEFFDFLYNYFGKIDHLGILKLQKAVDEIFNLHKEVKDVIFFCSLDRPKNFVGEDFACDRYLKAILESYASEKSFKLNIIFTESKAQKPNWLYARLKRYWTLLKNISLAEFKDKISYFQQGKHSADIVKTNRNVILAVGALYDLNFIKDRLDNLFWINNEKDARLDAVSASEEEQMLSFVQISDSLGNDLEAIDKLYPDDSQFDRSLLKLIYERISNHFKDNSRCFGEVVLKLKKLKSQCNIVAAIWGSQPVASNYQSVMFAYLKNLNIPIVGMQHGGCVLNQNTGLSFYYREAKRCSHYLSYGIDRDYISRNFPGGELETRIYPVGSTKDSVVVNTKTGGDEVDFLYPVMGSYRFFRSTLTKTDFLDKVQLDILKTLEQWQDSNSVLKFPGSYHEFTTSFYPLINSFKHLKKVSNVTLLEFLSRNKVNAVIFDCPSTPLFEVLPLDVEIFMVKDPVFSFHEEAEELLAKRVHLYDNSTELIAGLECWKNNKLSSLENDEFYHKFVYKPESKNNIMAVLNEIQSADN
jgi:hypothetical protein